MRRRTQRNLTLAAVVVVVGAVGWYAWGPQTRTPHLYSGYVEGEPLYLSAAVPGTVSVVSVERGQRVEPGQPLFAIDAGPLMAQREQAAGAVAAAQAQAADARKGQRPAELAVYDAEQAAAEAGLRQAEEDFDRVKQLQEQGVYAPAHLDAARNARDAAAAQVKAIQTRRRAATLGARSDTVAAADALVVQARGQMAEAQAHLDDVSPHAPAAGRVQDVFYQQGEWAAPYQPVVALIPDSRVRIRFFVPEQEVARYRVGGAVRFTCDGCRAQTARIDYVSPRPEFTPPVIYSRDARDRMVFLVEARPADPRVLNPGQPIDVVPLESAS